MWPNVPQFSMAVKTIDQYNSKFNLNRFICKYVSIIQKQLQITIDCKKYNFKTNIVTIYILLLYIFGKMYLALIISAEKKQVA